jgi:hypothetical protein
VAVTFDAVGPSSSGSFNTSGNAQSWSHTCAAGDTELLVGCCQDMNPDTGVTMSATYNGVAMTSLGVAHPGGGTAGFLQVWRMANPPAGSALTVTVTPSNPGASNGLNGASLSFAGSGALSAIQSATGSSGSASLGFTGSAAGNLVAMFCGGGNPLTSTAGTSRFVCNGDNAQGAGNSAGATVAGGGTVTCTWTLSSTGWAVIAVEVQVPAGTDTSPAWATSASDLGGGSGSWAATGNADGAPDGSVATWTAP